MKHAVIVSGGKQYIVKQGSTLYVDKVNGNEGDSLSVQMLATFDNDTKEFELNTNAKKTASVKILGQVKGDKVRVAKFKSKVRYHKVRGFRHYLTQLEVVSI